jgi:opacity protein-like surface antigen
MKKTIRTFALVGAGCLGLLACPQMGHGQGFYFNASAGASIAEDVDLKQFLVQTPGVKMKLDVGPQFSAAGGYNFNEYIGAQLETGFIYNEVSSVSGGGSIDASLSHMPMLADVVLRYDKPDCRWVPYAGVGAGGDVSVLSVDHVIAPNGVLVDGSDGTVVFAWQAFAGLRYKFSQTMSLGAAYKFFSSNGATWEVENSSGKIEAGMARVHSVGLEFTLKF